MCPVGRCWRTLWPTRAMLMRYRARVPSRQAPRTPEPHRPDVPADAGALRRLGRAARRGVRKAATPSVVRGTAVEVAWTVTHVVTYPLGVLEEKVRHPEERTTLEGLAPIQRGLIIGDVEAAGTPIILIHGVVDNRSVFAMLKRGLRRRGFGRIITLNYSPLTDDVRVVADRLESLVEQVCVETGFERVHVIGHSMGGLVGRYFVQRMGGDSRVHTLVTLGTPHQGTAPATLVPHPVARQMRPGSDIMTELAAPSPGCRTRFVAIWSDLDQMIVPKSNARIEHADLNARNVLVPSVGHNSLPVDGRVVHEICTTLAHLGADGSTLAEGATSIASAPSRQARPER
jgi:triacylglycerol lipase